MPYDKETIEQAKKKGIFEEKVFDSKALMLNEEEKNKISGEITKKMNGPTNLSEYPESKSKRNEEIKEFNVELNFIEKIIISILSYLGFLNIQNYKLNKAIHNLEKKAARLKPPIYNVSSSRVSKFLAYQLHSIYLKSLPLKNIYRLTIDDKENWNNPALLHKSGVEILFESLAKMNFEEIEKKFSTVGISKAIMEISNINTAIDEINSAIVKHINSIEKPVIETINKIYTNIIYIKYLIDFDFYQLFKHFDSQYSSSSSPNFTDISGETIAYFLSSLEEILMQIDLYLDNTMIYKIMDDIARELSEHSKTDEDSENEEINSEIPAPVNNIEDELNYLFENLKDLFHKNCFTLLLQIIKRDPTYFPSFIHTNYDLYKIYCETFVQRMKNIVKVTIKEKKQKKIEEAINKVFERISWLGVYGPDLSDRLESSGTLGLSHIYQLGLINTFFINYYIDIIKPFLNILLMNGIFLEKHQQKNASEFFYLMEKFEEKFRYFHEEMKPEGSTANKIFSLLTKKEGNSIDHKKSLEKFISSVNGKAKELFDDFYNLFTTMVFINHNLHDDINSKTSKYIRNIHYIGGLKNTKLLQNIERSYQVMLPIKDIIDLMRD